MKCINETIINIIFNPDAMYIQCIHSSIIAPIINNSVQINIYDEDNINIGICGININDKVKIYYCDKINDMIKPLKIIKKTQYKFNDETSDSDTS